MICFLKCFIICFLVVFLFFFFFFFQAEDGIRDVAVTGVQTCALPISRRRRSGAGGHGPLSRSRRRVDAAWRSAADGIPPGRGTRGVRAGARARGARSEERRVGKECRCRWGRDQWKKKNVYVRRSGNRR